MYGGRLILGVGLLMVVAVGCRSTEKPSAEPVPESITPRAVLSAQEELSQQLNVAIDEIHYLAFRKVVWPDGCLGMTLPEMSCDDDPLLGWWILLTTGERRFRFRTDLEGDLIRPEP